jgi:hypothetical protein
MVLPTKMSLVVLSWAVAALATPCKPPMTGWHVARTDTAK